VGNGVREQGDGATAVAAAARRSSPSNAVCLHADRGFDSEQVGRPRNVADSGLKTESEAAGATRTSAVERVERCSAQQEDFCGGAAFASASPAAAERGLSQGRGFRIASRRRRRHPGALSREQPG
jgi:hypothetical protein